MRTWTAALAAPLAIPTPGPCASSEKALDDPASAHLAVGSEDAARYFTPMSRSSKNVYWYPAMYARVEPRRDGAGIVAGLHWTAVDGQSLAISRIDDRRSPR